jgi:hypothetical protein
MSVANGSAWAARSAELALWAWARLVNRTDVWGGYVPETDRGREYLRADGATQKLGKTLTRPGVSQRGKVFLTEAHLVAHFRARGAADLVGLHTTAPDNTSRWGAVEVDQHGEGGSGPDANLAASLAWYGRLLALGFHPLLTTSNGAGGYHLRFLLDAPAPSPRVFAFLRALTADHAAHGLTARPETFPKQATVAPAGGRGQYGNWLRLPGRHHTKEHWSLVWDGERWLEGAGAVDFILGLNGGPAALVPEVPAPTPPAPRPRRFVAHAGGDLSRRINGYMARLPNLGEGQGRDDVAYRFACWLVRNLGLADDEAHGWLQQWDAGNTPPKGAERLREIIVDAHAYGRAAYGCDRGPTYQYLRPTRRPGHSILTITVEVNR